MVEHERSADQPGAARELALDRESDRPALGCAGLEQRIRAGRPLRLPARGGDERGGTAVKDAFRRGDEHDGVGLDERPVDAQRSATRLTDRDEQGILGVVDLDPPVEAPRKLRRDDAETLELTLARAPGESSRDEQGLTLRRDAAAGTYHGSAS